MYSLNVIIFFSPQKRLGTIITRLFLMIGLDVCLVPTYTLLYKIRYDINKYIF